MQTPPPVSHAPRTKKVTSHPRICPKETVGSKDPDPCLELAPWGQRRAPAQKPAGGGWGVGWSASDSEWRAAQNSGCSGEKEARRIADRPVSPFFLGPVPESWVRNRGYPVVGLLAIY